MKKALKFVLVFLCVSIFASVLLFAVKQTAEESTLPKAPIFVTYKPLESIYDPMAVLVTLPDNHNAEEVVLYFGDELGRYEGEIGRYFVEESTVTCEISNDVVFPEGATRIWAYTVNEKAESEDGYDMDLYATEILPLIEEDEKPVEETGGEKYVIILIGAALLLSFVGYLWLGRKKPEDVANTADVEDK